MQRVFGNIDALRFVDNRLDDDRRAAYLAHLADDPHEAERVAMWNRQNDVIRATFAGIAVEPVPLWLRLGSVIADRSAPQEGAVASDRRAPRSVSRPPVELRRVPRATEEPSAPLPRPLRHRSTTVGISAAVLLAIGLLVLVAAHTLLPTPLADEAVAPRTDAVGLSALSARATDAFRTFALDPLRPVEMPASQQAALDRWLQRRLGVPVRMPDLHDQGWTAMGGRLVPGDLGPGAYYVYENEAGDRLGIYIGRTTVIPSTTMSLDPLGGGSAAMTWVAGSLGYVLTVDKSLDWLSRNAEALHGRVMRAGLD